MKKIMQTLWVTLFVLLTTATFGYAEFTAAGSSEFPYFHLGCLIVGGLIIVSLKHKYNRIYLSEALGSFALYTVMVALFTAPVVDALKTLVS
jgi:FtsH-binding integral membrane protein